MVYNIYVCLIKFYTDNELSDKYDLEAEFLSVGDQIAKQKDNAVVSA